MKLNSEMRNGQNDEDHKRSSSIKKREMAKKISPRDAALMKVRDELINDKSNSRNTGLRGRST